MSETLIIDKDHLNLLLKDQSISTTKTAIIKELFGSNNITHYLLGPAGVGKSSIAKDSLGGVYASSIADTLEHVAQNKPTIIIQSNKPDPQIAHRAQTIYILDAPESRIKTQKTYRGETNSFTNFGRNEKATLGAPTDNIFNKAILNRDHRNKTSIYQLTDEPFSNQHEIIPLERYMEIPDISPITMGQTAGKFSPPHLGHTGMMSTILKDYNILNIIIGGSLSKHGFTSYEIQKILQKVFTNNQLIFGNLIQYGDEYFININGLIQQIDLEQSAGILGKERLPEGFESGTIHDKMIQEFLETNTHDITMPLKNMTSFGTIMRAPDVKIVDANGSELYISSSDYRSWVMNTKLYTKSTIQSRFDPSIAGLLTQRDNTSVIRQRLLNGILLEKSLIKISDQIKSHYQKNYQKKWGDTDFYTKDGKLKKFDGSTPKGTNIEEKKLLIKQMKGEIESQEDEIKKEHKAKDIGKLIGLDY